MFAVGLQDEAVGVTNDGACLGRHLTHNALYVPSTPFGADGASDADKNQQTDERRHEEDHEHSHVESCNRWKSRKIDDMKQTMTLVMSSLAIDDTLE